MLNAVAPALRRLDSDNIQQVTLLQERTGTRVARTNYIANPEVDPAGPVRARTRRLGRDLGVSHICWCQSMEAGSTSALYDV
jgi:hypothetical protein